MKITRVISLLILSLVATLTFAAGEAKQYTLQDVPNVRLSDVRQYVSDPSHILSAPARDSINAVLGRLEASTGIETAVVMLPSIGEADIFNFGHELFRQWGIGKGEERQRTAHPLRRRPAQGALHRGLRLGGHHDRRHV